jgi:hypothetical protein
MISPEEKIKALKAALIEARALQLLYFRRWEGTETREWEDLSGEERESQLWYQEYLLKKEMPEVFSDE